MKKIFLILYSSFFIFNSSFSQVRRAPAEVYPTNWWLGMKMNKIQLMFRVTSGEKIIPTDKLVFESSSKDERARASHQCAARME